jgi:hypothetical protein
MMFGIPSQLDWGNAVVGIATIGVALATYLSVRQQLLLGFATHREKIIRDKEDSISDYIACLYDIHHSSLFKINSIDNNSSEFSLNTFKQLSRVLILFDIEKLDQKNIMKRATELAVARDINIEEIMDFIVMCQKQLQQERNTIWKR